MSIDYLFLILSALVVLISPEGLYRRIAWVLLADFCIFIGFDEIWLASNIPGGDWMLPYKGFVYLGFFLIYGMVGSVYLSSLSAIAALYHSTSTILEPLGIPLPAHDYTTIMITYCILQLLGAFTGVMYGHLHRHKLHTAWYRHHHPNT